MKFTSDPTHKLECNHRLTDETKLQPMFNTCWIIEFYQGESISETLAVRFKTEEPSALFKQKFEECQAALRNASSQVTAAITESRVVSDVSASK